MWIESWDLADAFYMTIITVSTVGYGEVQPLSSGGRLFAVLLIGGGVANPGGTRSGPWPSGSPKRRCSGRKGEFDA